jgi:hypothetical protein
MTRRKKRRLRMFWRALADILALPVTFSAALVRVGARF